MRTCGQVLVLTAGWTLLQIGLVMPLLNRVTGTRQDIEVFVDLEGNLPLLLGLLLPSWTLAALGEEAVFRAYLPTRALEALGSSPSAYW